MEKVEARELEYWMGRKTDLEKELKRAKGVKLRMLFGLPAMDSAKRQKSQDKIDEAFSAVEAVITETQAALWRANWKIELLTGDSLLTDKERAAAQDYDAKHGANLTAQSSTARAEETEPTRRKRPAKKAGGLSLRKAAMIVSETLKKTQLGNGSITGAGLRNWIKKGCSPYDHFLVWRTNLHGTSKVFPCKLEEPQLREWCSTLEEAVARKNAQESPGRQGV